MRLVDRFGACDCHSHVFGPYAKFPLSSQRTFDPPESPIEQLETAWATLGIERAVLVQGSAHGDDHRALLDALARSPETRRGVALLNSDVPDSVLSELDSAGVRAVRFNWISHLLAKETRSEQQRFTDAEGLLQRVSRLAWHVELHVDIAYLEIASRLNIPSGMPVVIDHMARIDASASTVSAQVASLLRLMDRHSFWVKLSGADRLTANQEDLRAGLGPIRQILKAAPERCVWGLDWPHVNLARKRSDPELADLVLEAANNEKTLERVLIDNPQQLYGFHSLAH